MTKLHVLIADDEKAARHGMSRALASAGYELLEAADGNEALAVIRSGIADLAFLDLNMPVMNGWEVAKWLDADPLLGDIPVIVTSATREQGEKAKALHADAFLVKPFSNDEMLGIVDLFSALAP